MALTLLLLVVAGMLIRVVTRYRHTDLGFDPSHMLAVDLHPAPTRYENSDVLANFYQPLLDRVRGTAHFEVPQLQAQAIMRQLAGRLPGYLLPRLVREQAGAPAKTILASIPWDALHSSERFEC